MFLAAKEFPLPVEYRFLPLEEVFHEPPADLADRTWSSSTAATSTGCRSTSSSATARTVLNIDHHHDNTRFGTVNLVDVEASCTAEIVFELAKLLGVEMTREIATALYVGLVTDTGKFMYENTDAALAPDGRRADRGRRRRQRHLPPPLRARADREAAAGRPGAREDRALRRRPARDHLHLRRGLRGDRRRARCSPRGSSTTCARSRAPPVAAVVRDKTEGGRAARKVSLRSTDGAVDVSAIAREHGGGGHRRAAGFGTDLPYDGAGRVPARRGRRAARLSRARRARPARRQAGRGHLPRRRRPGPPRARREGRPRGHARSVRHRPADRPARPRDPPAALRCWRCRRPTSPPPGSAGARPPATPTAS